MTEQPFVIAGPCALEDTKLTVEVADELSEVGHRLGVEIIFKVSFDKANRLSANSGRGQGLTALAEVFNHVRRQLHMRTLTDIHECWQADVVAESADVLQIPAMLSRQTDLVVAAARTGRIVNIKKGQFLAPEDMSSIAAKAGLTPERLWLTERGTSFGYRDLVVDMRSLPIMRQLGYPIVFDVTHSVQHPGGLGGASGGNRAFVPYLARAAAAVGVDGFFFEVHPDPNNAVSDGPNMVPLGEFESMLQDVVQIWRVSAQTPIKPFVYPSAT